ncbi:MAG: ECF transporter S component [Clostridia bacterium]|nr:ECF transporter S component [Clostridia bacterium]
MNNTTKKTVIAALLAALCCVATMVVKIPSPLNGYLNLGDCIVLICGWALSPAYGFLAAALGSALADLFAGYIVYAPATFFIKGAMALTAYFLVRRLKAKKTTARLIGGVLAEILMILGYFVFEGFLYGFLPSAVNIPANAVQGVAGIVLGLVLMQLFDKVKVRFN